ncbi:MAG TPA: glycosyl hydrolase, partial [Blastocatellia bacterium]|nr:glycosyl hydrolase [Blastocatellia bacterium]
MIRFSHLISRPALIGILAAILVSPAALQFSSNAQTGSIETLQGGFEQPPDDSKIMMRWWWYGPSVVKSQLERELRTMKAGGIGGIEVQPVYPLSPDDPTTGIKNLQFLSDEFLDALSFTADKSRELGLRLDLTLG